MEDKNISSQNQDEKNKVTIESKKEGKSSKKSKKNGGAPFRHLKRKKKKSRRPLKKPKHLLGKIRYHMLMTIRTVQDMKKKYKKLKRRWKKFFKKKKNKGEDDTNDDDNDDDNTTRVKKVHFWNLNPALESVRGLPDSLCSPESWYRLKQFCEANYITQETLEAIYTKLKFSFVSRSWDSTPTNYFEEDDDDEDVKNRYKSDEEELKTKWRLSISSPSSVEQLFVPNDHENILVLMLNEMYKIPIPKDWDVPNMVPEHRQDREIDFTNFFIKSYLFCCMTDDDNVLRTFRLYIDYLDAKGYTGMRNEFSDNPIISHAEFLSFVTFQYPNPSDILIVLDEHLEFMPRNTGKYKKREEVGINGKTVKEMEAEREAKIKAKEEQKKTNPYRNYNLVVSSNQSEDESLLLLEKSIQEEEERKKKNKIEEKMKDIRLYRFMRSLYIYPILVWPTIAMTRLIRRKLFGSAFWERYEMDVVDIPVIEDAKTLAKQYRESDPNYVGMNKNNEKSKTIFDISDRPDTASSTTTSMTYSTTSSQITTNTLSTSTSTSTSKKSQSSETSTVPSLNINSGNTKLNIETYHNKDRDEVFEDNTSNNIRENNLSEGMEEEVDRWKNDANVIIDLTRIAELDVDDPKIARLIRLEKARRKAIIDKEIAEIRERELEIEAIEKARAIRDANLAAMTAMSSSHPASIGIEEESIKHKIKLNLVDASVNYCRPSPIIKHPTNQKFSTPIQTTISSPRGVFGLSPRLYGSARSPRAPREGMDSLSPRNFNNTATSEQGAHASSLKIDSTAETRSPATSFINTFFNTFSSFGVTDSLNKGSKMFLPFGAQKQDVVTEVEIEVDATLKHVTIQRLRTSASSMDILKILQLDMFDLLFVDRMTSLSTYEETFKESSRILMKQILFCDPDYGYSTAVVPDTTSPYTHNEELARKALERQDTSISMSNQTFEEGRYDETKLKNKLEEAQDYGNDEAITFVTDSTSNNDCTSVSSTSTDVSNLMNQYDIEVMFDPSELALPELKFLLPMMKQKLGYNVSALLFMTCLTENEKMLCEKNHLKYNLNPEQNEKWLNHMIVKGNWNKYLDPKRRIHFFHNVQTGESTWEIPRWSKYFNVYRRECRQDVALRDKKIKIITISKTQYKRREIAERKKRRKQRIGFTF